ncbi:hypothetical protein, partial [Staphylococcus aureus]|uniref:hypothetical protein n=1 Tax=Staphylococcus aureus TaxID=1280 RepID=UPI0039BDB667
NELWKRAKGALEKLGVLIKVIPTIKDLGDDVELPFIVDEIGDRAFGLEEINDYVHCRLQSSQKHRMSDARKALDSFYKTLEEDSAQENIRRLIFEKLDQALFMGVDDDFTWDFTLSRAEQKFILAHIATEEEIEDIT